MAYIKSTANVRVLSLTIVDRVPLGPGCWKEQDGFTLPSYAVRSFPAVFRRPQESGGRISASTEPHYTG
jgi:hypothetical protein